MPEYFWQAASPNGQLREGHIEASDESTALSKLLNQGLTPILISGGQATARPAGRTDEIGQTQHVRKSRWPFSRRGEDKITPRDILNLTSELSIMLRAGLALDNALKVLVSMTHKRALSDLVQVVLEQVKSGSPLSRALEQHKAHFSDFYVNMIRSGEASGQMAQVLERLVDHLERVRALRENVISASVYPLILLVVAVLSLVAMLGFVVPQFEKLFTDLGDALPWPTRLVMNLGHAFSDFGVVIGLVVGAIAWVLLRWLRSASGRRWWQAKSLRLPILGNLLLKYQLTLYARSLGTLLGNGVPLLTSLRIATETVGNQLLHNALITIPPKVKEGGRLADAVRATAIFDPLSINLIRVGEETGRIGPMMLELAHILNREVETGIKRALTLLEPALIIVLGLMIASIIVSILMGILSINDLAV